MSLTEDRAAFFADFGVDAQIGAAPGVPAGVGGTTVRVIFDNDFLASMDVESSNPVALANFADLAGVQHGTSVSIPAGEFSESFTGTIIGIQPDGTGFGIIELEAA